MDNTLISNYLPADYQDACHKLADTTIPLLPEEILKNMFSGYPGWLEGLFKIRTWLVKPFGLETGKMDFTKLIIARTDTEILIGQNDRHLQFYVSIRVSPQTLGQQEVIVTTLVKYHNTLGRVYFFFIRPFHLIIVPAMLRLSLKRINERNHPFK